MNVKACRLLTLFAVTCPLITSATLRAQATARTAAPDASALSKYDKNHDGVLDSTERAAMESDERKTVPVESSSTDPDKDDVIVLSPFEVSTENNRGYYSANSTSGTRFNTKVEDLAASLTVVTKEMMNDLAMVDINDVFQYTAGTEGTGTYTAFTIDRNGSVSDGVQSNPTGSNRVRGILPANISYNNNEVTGRLPIDSALVDAVEISRGPNANVFGLGNPSGTVNQVPISANIVKDINRVTSRVDSYSGYRETLDINRILLKNKLAVRFTGVFQHEGFERKPSGVNSVFYDGMIKYKPFKNTTISASYLYYRMNGNRPNFIPPRDNISYWIAKGKPTWDPITQTVHVGGTTLGPFTTATGLPDYFTATFTGSTHSFGYVDQTGLKYWAVPIATASDTPLTGAPVAVPSNTARYLSTTSASGVSGGRITGQPLFTTTPTVTDKSIYDWTEDNISAINRVMDRVLLSNVMVDQFFFDTPRQQLVGQASFLREDTQRYTRNLLGTANDNGQSGQLFVDINERLLDGSPNPFFLRPYFGTDQPRTTWAPAKWDTYRAQLAYKLDLTHEKNWLKWLGLHQVTGYDEYKYRVNRQYSYRDAITSNNSWIPVGLSRGNQGVISNGGPAAALGLTRLYWRYYVGDANGNNVDYAPTDFSYGKYNLVYGNASTGFVNEPTSLGQVAVTDATGAGSNIKTILKTVGAVAHSHFLDDHIVTTFGVRDDKQYVKTGATPQLLNPDGITFNYDSLNHWKAGDYNLNSGRTTQGGAEVRPFQDLSFVNRLRNNGGLAGFLGEVMNGFQLTYNKSDSFTPLDPRISLYQQALPNSTGQGKDYGFGLNLYHGKVVLRVNHYETLQLNFRGGDASTIAQRVLRTDVASTAAFLLQTQALLWVAGANPGNTIDQIHDKVAAVMGIPWNTQVALNDAFNAGTIASTNDVNAHGTEVELNFNPTNYWTVAGSVTDAQVSTNNVSPDIANWLAQRLPYWTTIEDPRFVDTRNPGGHELWWNHNYGGSQTAAQNYATFIQTPFSVIQQLEGKSNPEIRRYNVRLSTRLKLNGLTDLHVLKDFSVGGAVRWESRSAIGYLGRQALPAVITDLDASRPIYDKPNYYYDAFITYRTKLWGRTGMTIQLNATNIFESGHLQPISAFPDGTPSTYRIVDPRRFVLQASFDL